MWFYFYYAKEEYQSEEDFKSQGFNVGKYSLSLKLDKLGVTLSIRKPKPLGGSHTNNKSGREYFSNALGMEVSNETRKLFDLQIDERGFNTCYKQSGETSPLSEWMVDEFYKMKSSDPGYGDYVSRPKSGTEGRKKLYAHDFMLWLKNHQDSYSG